MTVRAWYTDLLFSAVALILVGVLAARSGILAHDGTCVVHSEALTWVAPGGHYGTPPETCAGSR